MTEQQKDDIAIIGESISEGGCSCHTHSYENSDKGILIVSVADGARYYKIKITPTERPIDFDD